MTAKDVVPTQHETDEVDVEYLHHADGPLLARIFRPRGSGPFPLLVAAHGGAWCLQDRLTDSLLYRDLARRGVVIVSLDFRMPPIASYPASLADINYGIRWSKEHAAEYGSRPDLVGVIGTSSGGQQVMLVAMRTTDERYTSLALPEGSAQYDATVRCAVLCWPVIDPLGRYEYANNLKAQGEAALADFVVPLQGSYWGSEAAMAEGSPVRALERGEDLETPPVLYVQGKNDTAHPRPDLDRFVAAYGAAGGAIQVEIFDGEMQGFLTDNRSENSDSVARAIDLIVDFLPTVVAA